jgi:hypothetical protein
MPNTMQSSRAFARQWIRRRRAQADGNPNLLSANRNDEGRWLNANWDNPDNRWNRDNGFAFAVPHLSSFLLLRGGVLFPQLTAPAAEHPACVVELAREVQVPLII